MRSSYILKFNEYGHFIIGSKIYWSPFSLTIDQAIILLIERENIRLVKYPHCFKYFILKILLDFIG